MSRRPLACAAVTATALLIPLLGSPASATSASGAVASSYVSPAAVSALCATETPAVQAGPDSGAETAPTPVSVTPEQREVELPTERQHADTPTVTDNHLEAVSPERPAVAARQASSRMTDTVVVPVHVTLVRGKHRGDYNRRPKAVRSWINLLNNAYAGGQNPGVSAGTRYTFVLKSVRQVRNERWYHAVGNSKADQQMRRKLHRGGAGSLNLYVTRPGRGGDILGFARFPWQYAAAPRQDGVTVNVDSMPGGRINRYNLGDTLVHEVGHWMGLFHTFEGECGTADLANSGDLVIDTPAEAEPNLTCNTGSDSCLASPGLDPVQNFMDYSWDSCMNQFTPGQVSRMDTVFEQYRYGR